MKKNKDYLQNPRYLSAFIEHISYYGVGDILRQACIQCMGDDARCPHPGDDTCPITLEKATAQWMEREADMDFWEKL